MNSFSSLCMYLGYEIFYVDGKYFGRKLSLWECSLSRSGARGGKTPLPGKGGPGRGLKLFGGQQAVSNTFLPLTSPGMAVRVNCG